MRKIFPPTDNFLRPSRTAASPVVGAGRPRARAFSLVEIVLALGIISFALIGIMGLFPVAMQSAQESQRETRATHIARQIFTDLSTLPGTNRFLITGTNFSSDRVPVNLAAAESHTVYFDAGGRAMGAIAPVDATYGAEVTVTPNTPLSGMARVETTISTPPTAISTNGSHHTFITLMSTR